VDEPLRGTKVAVGDPDSGADVGVRTCLRHLVCLGASVADEGDADFVLEAEGHPLAGGGLAASEATAQAALGLTDYIDGFPGSPARTGADVASSVAGFCAAQLVLARAALPGTHAPARIRVSALRALSSLKTILWAARSRPDAWAGTHVLSRERGSDGGYRTRDGRITLDFPRQARESWLSFTAELGIPSEIIGSWGDRWFETFGWGDDVDEARRVYDRYLGHLDTEEAIAAIRRHGGSSVPFQTLEQCLDHPQAHAVGLPESLSRGLPWTVTVHGDTRTARPDAPSGRPLAGLRVLDMGVGGVGPFAGALLAWLGADVIKVEAPNEFILEVAPLTGGVSAAYLALNAGKRSIALNLRNERDREAAMRLAQEADLIVENFRPGALERLGFGFDALASANPGLVYCSSTGFGPTGPLAFEPCTDLHMQAFSGFACSNAEAPDGEPRRVRYYAFVDLVSSTVLAEAACAGLLARQRVGGPVRVETSMLQAAVEAQRSILHEPRPVLDGIFATLDGHVAVTCRSGPDWERLASLMQGLGRSRPDIGDVEDRFRSRPSAAWAHDLERAGLPCARVAHDEEAMSRHDLWQDGVLRELDTSRGDRLTCGGVPWADAGSGETRVEAPLPNEHASAAWHPRASSRGRSDEPAL
jgi:crotonobetainyl-CoA:carnitine CoA-transferase CaiB-like acyl-CoA transferase